MKKKLVGRDSSGNNIFVGDEVEVTKEEDTRVGDSDYTFCSVGKRGRVIGFFAAAIITVKFSGHDPVGCYTGNLLKI